MALEVQFELWDGEPTGAGSATSTLSLLSYTNDLEIASGGYAQQVVEGLSDSVWEVIVLRLKGSSHDDLAAKLQTFASYVDRANFSNSGFPYSYQVWLHVKLTNETKARYAYIYEIRSQSDSFYSQLPLGKNAVSEYRITFRRSPYWEHKDQTTLSFSASSTINLIGGIASISNTVGDVPARLLYTNIIQSSGSITNLWMGFISERNYPSSANWLSRWPLSSSYLFGADTTTAADATAYAGTRTQVSFATVTSLAERARIAVGDMYAANNEIRARGKFLVLLRARTSAAGNVMRVRLSTGLFGSPSFSLQNRVQIDQTAWFIYEMGIANFPFNGQPNYSSNISRGDCLRLEAERVSGAGSLYFDNFILIPISEMYMKFVGSIGASASLFQTNLYTGNTILQRGLAYYSERTADAQFYGGIPVGTSRVVMAGYGVVSALTDAVTINSMLIKSRFRELRGNA